MDNIYLNDIFFHKVTWRGSIPLPFGIKKVIYEYGLEFLWTKIKGGLHLSIYQNVEKSLPFFRYGKVLISFTFLQWIFWGQSTPEPEPWRPETADPSDWGDDFNDQKRLRRQSEGAWEDQRGDPRETSQTAAYIHGQNRLVFHPFLRHSDFY